MKDNAKNSRKNANFTTSLKPMYLKIKSDNVGNIVTIKKAGKSAGFLSIYNFQWLY